MSTDLRHTALFFRVLLLVTLLFVHTGCTATKSISVSSHKQETETEPAIEVLHGNSDAQQRAEKTALLKVASNHQLSRSNNDSSNNSIYKFSKELFRLLPEYIADERLIDFQLNLIVMPVERAVPLYHPSCMSTGYIKNALYDAFDKLTEKKEGEGKSISEQMKYAVGYILDDREENNTDLPIKRKKAAVKIIIEAYQEGKTNDRRYVATLIAIAPGGETLVTQNKIKIDLPYTDITLNEIKERCDRDTHSTQMRFSMGDIAINIKGLDNGDTETVKEEANDLLKREVSKIGGVFVQSKEAATKLQLKIKGRLKPQGLTASLRLKVKLHSVNPNGVTDTKIEELSTIVRHGENIDSSEIIISGVEKLLGMIFEGTQQ